MFIARFISNYSGVAYLTYYTSFFLPPFLSSFLAGGAFPPFLFLSSVASSYLLKILIASDISFSSLGKLPSLVIISKLES
jgi:hypothetical protein